jgi:hypothetical protein
MRRKGQNDAGESWCPKAVSAWAASLLELSQASTDHRLPQSAQARQNRMAERISNAADKGNGFQRPCSKLRTNALGTTSEVRYPTIISSEATRFSQNNPLPNTVPHPAEMIS